MTIYKLKQVKVITVEPKSEIDALFEVLEKIAQVPFRMQHIVLVYECNLSVWNIYSEVENKLSDLKVVT
jgi:heterodisulfide reductase subunit B